MILFFFKDQFDVKKSFGERDFIMKLPFTTKLQVFAIDGDIKVAYIIFKTESSSFSHGVPQDSAFGTFFISYMLPLSNFIRQTGKHFHG